MKRINLLPKIEQREFKLELLAKQFLTFWLWVMITLVIFVLAIIASQIYLAKQNQIIKEALIVKQQTLASTGTAQLKSEIVSLNSQVANIKTLSVNHYYWSKALADLGNILPADAQVDLLTLNRASGQIDIQGTAGTRESVLQFWSELHKSQYFKDINFPLSNLDQAVNAPFTFKFFVNTETIKQP